jgi:P4 family phage/plasmid primase-like protien
MTIDLTTFLAAIFQHASPHELIAVTPIRDRSMGRTQFIPVESLSQITQIIRSHNAQDWYFRISNVSMPQRKNGRGLESETTGCGALYVDLDRAMSHDEAIAFFKTLDAPPSIIVSSGRGYHAYWLLDRFYTDIQILKTANDCLRAKLGADACFSLDHILRLPETFNYKYDKPRPVEIIHADLALRYRLDQFQLQSVSPTVVNPASDELLSDISQRNPKLFKRIQSELTARKAGADLKHDQSVDRSRNDAFIVTQMLAMQYSRQDCIDILTDPQLFSGSRYKESQRLDYVIRTVDSAILKREQSPERYFVSNGRTARCDILKIGNELCDEFHYCMIRGAGLHWYAHGVFHANGETHVRAQLVKRLSHKWSMQLSREIEKWITDRIALPLDAFDHHDQYINCANGMIDYTTGNLLPHNPIYKSLLQLPWTYDPAVVDHTIKNFLEDILGSGLHTVLEFAASSFLRSKYWPKCLLWLIGPSNTGKSAALRMVTHFFGEFNTCAVSIQDLADQRFSSAMILNKYLNCYADLSETAVRSTGKIKMLTGDDVYLFERKFQDPINYAPTTRHIFSANSYIRTMAPDMAYYQRIVIVPCTRVFPVVQKDWLSEICTPQAMSGFLNDMIEALRNLLERQALYLSHESKAAHDAFVQTADSIHTFIEEYCIKDPLQWVEKSTLYTSYDMWCRIGNMHPVNRDTFFKRLADLYDKRFTDGDIQDRGRKTYVIHGLRLPEES